MLPSGIADWGNAVQNSREPARWREVREAALVRDEHKCRRCGASNPAELDVHHLVPRRGGGQDELSNLISLCDGCHAALHLNLQVGLARRMLERWAVRLARWLDFQRELPPGNFDFGPVLHLLGKTRLRDGQLPIILAILAGKDVLAVRPTGSGKSLCFQVPVLLRPGTALVFEPLKALMKDQVRSLQDLQIPATFMSSDVPFVERRRRLDLLEKGAWKFVYLTPERFDLTAIMDSSERDRLLLNRPTYMIIDEAHTVPQYGDGFRPMYAQLGAIREAIGRPQLLAFTATASRETQRKICHSLGSPDALVLAENPDRPNIALVRVHIRKDDAERFEILRRQIDGIYKGKAIIFVPTVNEGKRVQAGLARLGMPLEFFHAKAEEAGWRDQVQGRFLGRLDPPIKAIIATSAFGMGIDIPDVRLVVHWQHPFSVEEYLQGVGRAGRDGEAALAILFNDPGDAGLLRFMIKDSPQAIDREHEIAAIEAMASSESGCFRKALVTYLVGRDVPKKSLSLRILDWAFGQRAQVQTAVACCDFCSPELAAKVQGTRPRRLRPNAYSRVSSFQPEGRAKGR